MARACLEFNLPDENSEHLAALNGSSWKNVAYEIDRWLREKIKYAEEGKVYQPVRDALHEIMRENHVDFE